MDACTINISSRWHEAHHVPEVNYMCLTSVSNGPNRVFEPL